MPRGIPKNPRVKKENKPKQYPYYELSLEIGGKRFFASGSTIIEALNGLHPDLVKTKGNISVTKFDKDSVKTATRFLFIMQMKKLFSEQSNMMKTIHQTQFSKFSEMMLK